VSETKTTGTSFALILLLCLALRLGYVLSLEKHPPEIPSDGYVQIASNILAGKGFAPTPLRHWFSRPPGYPLFIAAVWSPVRSSARFVAIELAQVALSVATCGLLFVIANPVFGRRAALAGALLFAISPSWIAYCTKVSAETLIIFLVALAALMALRLYRSASPLTALGLGLIWGAAGLTRPEATFLIPVLLVPVLGARHLGIPQRFMACASAALGKIAIMAPWVVRNYLVYGAFVLHVPLGGNGLFAGAYPYPPVYGKGWCGTFPDKTFHYCQTREYREITGPFWDPEGLAQAAGRPDPDVEVRDERDLLEVDRRLAAAGWSYIKNYKIIQLYNMTYHFYRLWGRPAGWDELRWPIKLPWFGSYLAFLALCVLGILTAWRSGKLAAVPLSWLILMVCHTGLLLPVCTEQRYQAASAIFLYMFGGFGADSILPSPAPGAATMAGPGSVVGEGGWSGS